MNDDNEFIDFDENDYITKLYEEGTDEDVFASSNVVFENQSQEDNIEDNDLFISTPVQPQDVIPANTVSEERQDIISSDTVIRQQEVVNAGEATQEQQQVISTSTVPDEKKETLTASSDNIKDDIQIKKAANFQPKFDSPQKIKGSQKK